MKRITVLINGSREVIYFDQPISFLPSNYDVEEQGDRCPHIFVKRATIFWDYNNFTEEPSFSIGGGDIILIPGYYTFGDLTKLMKPYGIDLQLYDHNNTVYVENKSQQELKLTRLATLLWLDDPTVLPDQGSTFGDKQMDINCGMKFLNIHCDIACESYYNGHGSGVIASLEVPTPRGLKVIRVPTSQRVLAHY